MQRVRTIVPLLFFFVWGGGRNNISLILKKYTSIYYICISNLLSLESSPV